MIYGGAAGGGKTFGLFLEAVKDCEISGSRFVYFRRQQTDINKAGGPWDKSMAFFPLFGATPNKTSYKWKFASGAEGQFASLQYNQDVLNWQTAEVDLFLFDELTHFTENQFWYMLSRNRSPLKTKKRIRAGTNPDGGSWVKKLIAPWVDNDWDGVVEGADKIKYKAPPALPGELRYLARDPEGNMIWVDEDWRYPANAQGYRSAPKSITFIPSMLSDNRKMVDNDPEYESNLLMQEPVNAARLLRGDWSVMVGNFFVEWGSDPTHMIVPPYVGSLPSNWHKFGGLDANGISKGAFTLCASDENGEMHVVESIYHEGKTPLLFCADVCAVLARWGLSRTDVMIAADPAMFTANQRRDQIGEADIECYWRAGLKCFEANNNRLHGWSRAHEWLQAPGKFHVWKGYNEELINQFPKMLADPLKPGDMLKKDMIDDPHDSWRYGIMTRPRPANPIIMLENASEVQIIVEMAKASAEDRRVAAEYLKNKAKNLRR